MNLTVCRSSFRADYNITPIHCLLFASFLMLSFISGSFSMQFFFIDAMSDKNSKFYFTPEERDVFIDFVRENTILYRNKNKGARDVKEKNRLWKQIASQINKKREHMACNRIATTNNSRFSSPFFLRSGNLQEKMVHDERRLLAIHVEIGWKE